MIPRPMLLGNIVMLNMKKPAPIGTTLSLRLEAVRGLSLKTANNLIVYLISIMLLYCGQSYSDILLCLIYRSRWNLGQFLLCVWKLFVVWLSKYRILQLNCLFNNYNVVLPRPMVFVNIVLLNMKEPAPIGTILTLRLESMCGLTLETSNFAT